ncbi:MAG: SDR family oxidoreductase [Hyphomicrobium sp.]
MPPRTSKDAQTALITGGAKRIGRAVTLGLARGGWTVAIHYQSSKAAAHSLVDEIVAAGGRAVAFAADLRDCTALEPLVASVAERLGPPACLINNASEFLPDKVETLCEANWDAHLDINLKAPVFLARAMVRHLPAEASGNIINIIDQRVWKLTADFFSYTISKAGLWTATRTLAQGLAPHIRVNAIGPGPVLRSVHQTDADFEAEIESTLLRAGPSPDDIAAAVAFILSSPSMTGQMIALDSGQHLT